MAYSGLYLLLWVVPCFVFVQKHHYSELTHTLKEEIGDIPDGFVRYFTSRFPRLLIHVYNRMEILKNEHIFYQYYNHFK